jgi:hypothetical protein
MIAGRKTHEIREMDRPFAVGDVLRLREYDPGTAEYTGRDLDVDVTHLSPPGWWGLSDNLCVMSTRIRNREVPGEPIETSYTRAQLAEAVDEAHAALHEANGSGLGSATSDALAAIARAHEALHKVGADLPSGRLQRLNATITTLRDQPDGAKIEARLTALERAPTLARIAAIEADIASLKAEVFPGDAMSLPGVRVQCEEMHAHLFRAGGMGEQFADVWKRLGAIEQRLGAEAATVRHVDPPISDVGEPVFQGETCEKCEATVSAVPDARAAARSALFALSLEQDRIRQCPNSALHALLVLGRQCSCGYEGRA